MPFGLYSGPLKRGVKSKDARTRKSMVGKSAYYKRKKAPPRTRGGTLNYKKSYPMSKATSAAFGETKLKALREINNQAPVEMRAGGGAQAPVYGLRFVLGDALSQYQDYTALQGFSWSRGIDGNERIGNYLYLKKTHVTLQINMNQVGVTNGAARRFRVIIFKAKREASPTGVTRNPNTSLMLDNEGEPFGITSAGSKEMLDYSHQLLNKRNFVIMKDTSFMLQNPVINPSASVDPLIASSGQYPSQKTMKLNLPHWKRTKFDNDTNLPTNLNYNYGIYIQAVNVGSNTAIPDDWNLSLRGTVSANDS